MRENGLNGLEVEVRIDDVIRKSVVYVGDANGKPFVPHGTGFITVYFVGDSGYQNVVTARHVIDGIGPDIHLRVNTRGGPARVIPTEGNAWKEHPSGNVDLVTCPTLIPKDQFDIMHIDIDGGMMFKDYLNKDGTFGLGDEVFVAGMFISRLGDARNLPILRTGTIAAMPEEKIETSYGRHLAYLVETRSIDGLSGSPVFAFTSLTNIKNGQIQPTQNLCFGFIGVLLGTNDVVNRRDFISIQREGDDEEAEGVYPMLNTGIGIVAPADLVVETVKHPEITERRLAAKKERQETKG